MKNLAFVSLLLVFLFSCNTSPGLGKLPKGKENYAGTWTSNEVFLQIDKGGQVNYERNSGSTKTSVNGPIQKFNGNSFSVGILGITTDFVVSKPPHEENGMWLMTVDGNELTRMDQ
jgi:hypothetical protein